MSTLHPWSAAAKMAKRIRKPAPQFNIWKILKGDKVYISGDTRSAHAPQVEILAGKDAGKQGLVGRVIRRQNMVTVAGLNLVRSLFKVLGLCYSAVATCPHAMANPRVCTRAKSPHMCPT
jgi:hypothetical protein